MYQSTCTNMLYGELGATPLSLIAQSRMVMFWGKIKQEEENPKIVSLMFQILLKMYKNDTFCSPWVTTVKNVLEGCGNTNGNTNVSHLVQTILKSTATYQGPIPSEMVS